MAKKKTKFQYSPSAANDIQRRAMRKFGFLFILPTFIAFCIGFVYPFLWGIKLSFFKFKTIRFQEFVGLKNYVNALKDSSFFTAFKFTLGYTVVTVLLINIIAFVIALALTRGIKGGTAFRTIFFMPNLIGGIVLGYIWKIILDGIIGKLWGSALVLDSKFGFWGLVILLCWQQIGYMMIIYIAGLQNVPGDFIEAAKIDGASDSQILTKITIPSIMPTITICTFLTLTNSFKLFDQNLALTNGLPYVGTTATTQMLALNIYSSFYENLTSLGVGQAKAVIFFILVGIISITQLKFSKKMEGEA